MYQAAEKHTFSDSELKKKTASTDAASRQRDSVRNSWLLSAESQSVELQTP